MTAHRDITDMAELLEMVRARRAPPQSLWGVATAAPLHFGYDALVLAQKELVQLGFSHIVVLADRYTAMSHKLQPSQTVKRARYYQYYFEKCLGLDATYVLGSSFQLESDYVSALYALVGLTPHSVIRRHLPGPVRRSEAAGDSRVSDHLQAIMQCLDPRYFGVDLIFGDTGQRKIYALLDHLDFQTAFRNSLDRVRADAWSAPISVHVANAGCDIRGRQLRESSAATRITIHETRSSLERKIRMMYAPPSAQPLVPGLANALLRFFEVSVFPWFADVGVTTGDGAVHRFTSYRDFEAAYFAARMDPAACKQALTEYLWARLQQYRSPALTAISSWIDESQARGEKEPARNVA